jgi:DNA-binding response OmpR family regulator
LKLLIVDDDHDFRRVAKLALLADGYEVFEAGSGREALDLARREQPGLILLDVLMPGLDGYKVCHQLRANPATNRTAILVLTALGDPTASYKAKQAGADDYLAKPVSVSELRERIKRLLRRHELLHGVRRRAEESK